MSCVARHVEKLAFVFVCTVVLCVLVIILLFDICLRCSYVFPSVIFIAAQAAPIYIKSPRLFRWRLSAASSTF